MSDDYVGGDLLSIIEAQRNEAMNLYAVTKAKLMKVERELEVEKTKNAIPEPEKPAE